MSFRMDVAVVSALAGATLAACASSTGAPPPSPRGTAATSVAPAVSAVPPTSASADNHKPTAPIKLDLVATPSAAPSGHYTVTLIATAQADLDDVVVTIDGQRHRLGAMSNHAVTNVSSIVELGSKLSRDIIGSAQLTVHGRNMSKATALRLGAPAAPPPPAALVTLPDGTVVNEAR